MHSSLNKDIWTLNKGHAGAIPTAEWRVQRLRGVGEGGGLDIDAWLAWHMQLLRDQTTGFQLCTDIGAEFGFGARVLRASSTLAEKTKKLRETKEQKP